MQVLARCLSVAIHLIRLLPLSCVRMIGQRLGYCFASIPTRDVIRCREHLQRAFPDKSSDWILKTSARCFGHFGRTAFTLLRLLSIPNKQLYKLVSIEGLENFYAHRQAYLQGEGTIIVGGHFGNWELQMRFMGLAGDMYAVGRRMDNELLDDFIINNLRTKNNDGKTIYQDQGLLPCIRALRQAGSVCMVPDQDLPKIPGIFSTWFNIPAYTPSGPAKLARSQNVAIQPVFFYEKAGRFVFHWGPRKTFQQTDNEDSDIQLMTNWIMAYQERLVQENPEQWVWWHRRWRTQPQSD